MAVTYAVADTGKKNNNGVILHAGNIPSTGPASNLALTTNLAGVNRYGSVVAAANNSRLGLAPKPLTSGTYATMAEGKYIGVYMSGGVLAGVAYTGLNSPAADYYRRPIAKLETARRYHITSWNAVTGAATKGGNAGDAYNMIDPLTAGGATASADSAARPTWAVPGELTYMVTGSTPTQDDYKARTSN